MQIDLDKKRADVMKRMEEIRDQREGLKVRVCLPYKKEKVTASKNN
jgi:hypothetical protein